MTEDVLIKGKVGPYRIKRDDAVLYGIGALKRSKKELDLNRLSNTLGIRTRSLRNILSRLVKQGHISHSRKEAQRFFFTERGEKKFKDLEIIINKKIINNENFSLLQTKPEIKFSMMTDPYARICFINSLFFQGSTFDQAWREVPQNKNLTISASYIDEFIGLGERSSSDHFEEVLKCSSLYGVCFKDLGDDPKRSLERPIDLILEAELSRRKGEVGNAKAIYENLLCKPEGLNENSWLLCFIGFVQCLINENKIDASVQLIDEMLEKTNEPVHKAALKKLKADLFQDIGKEDEASSLYHSCLGTFNKKDHPVLRTAVLNNLGVLYFKKGNHRAASKMWEEAMKIARKEDLTWMTSIASVNLADVHSMDGKTRLALDYLRKARNVMKETGDLEGLSAVDFNMSLVQIDKGNLSLAEKYFKRSRSFPLTYEKKLAEREKAYNERLEMRRK
jgi:tetratricopeptide (TPR) repeat protein/predicted transcriptional regulator